jgi:hypothetical protein
MIEERDLRLLISNDTCLFGALFLFRERDTTKRHCEIHVLRKEKGPTQLRQRHGGELVNLSNERRKVFSVFITDMIFMRERDEHVSCVHLSLNQTPVIGTWKRCYFLRCTVEFHIGLLFPLTCDKDALSHNDFLHIQQLSICDLTEAIWALQSRSKTIIVWTDLASWLDSTVRCVSFYGAH